MKTNVSIGDRVSEFVEIHNRTMSGTVIYVHPKGRFYTVEFVGPTGETFRECFTGVRYKTTSYK